MRELHRLAHKTQILNSVYASVSCYCPRSMVYMPDPFPPGTFTANVTVWSTKKNDRGQFNVYVGTTLLVRPFSWYETAINLYTHLHLYYSRSPFLATQGTGNQYTSAAQETSTQRVFYKVKLVITTHEC